MDANIMSFFADIIFKELGIVYSEENYFQLNQRLEGICKLQDVASVEDLYQQAKTKGVTGQFRSLLLDVATNNETSFFRDPRVFKALESELFPKIIEERKDKFDRLQIWSAASSSGQEALSLAMTLLEMREKDPSLPEFKILGTDISNEILERAKKAEYSPLEVQRGLSAQRMIKYFDEAGDKMVAKPALRQRTDFRKENLLKLAGMTEKFDCIFCRNVLIYQNVENKAAIVKELFKNLKPGGYLVLGAAESLVGIDCELEREMLGGSVFYRKVA